MAEENLSKAEIKGQFEAIHERAERLGVLDISFSKADSSNILEGYNRTLDFIEKNKSILYQNAGETEQ